MLMKPGAPRFTAAEVFQIRLEWDMQTIDVRAWSRAKGCVPETIRKIGRRDTYTTGEFAREAGEQLPVRPGDEPTPEEMAASFARLQQAVDATPPQAVEVDEMLEAMRRGQP